MGNAGSGMRFMVRLMEERGQDGEKARGREWCRKSRRACHRERYEHWTDGVSLGADPIAILKGADPAAGELGLARRQPLAWTPRKVTARTGESRDRRVCS